MSIIDPQIAERKIKNFVKDNVSLNQGNNNTNTKQKELFSFFKKNSVKIEKAIKGSCKYFGQYKDSKKEGYGLYITQNGEEWLGNWHKGKKEGDFIGKSKSGNIYHYICKDGKVISKSVIYKKPNLNSGNRLRRDQIVNQENSQQAHNTTFHQRPRHSSATIQQNIARATENLVATGLNNNTTVANNINEIFQPQYTNQQQIQRPLFITRHRPTQILINNQETISIVPSIPLQQESEHLPQNMLENNSENPLGKQEPLVKSTIDIKKENEDLENEAADLFIKEIKEKRVLTKNTAININNPKIIEFIGKRKNKGKEIDIIANILKISKCKKDGKELFNCLKKLDLITPGKAGEDYIKKLFAILHQDNRTKYSKTFSNFFKTYCQEQSYCNGSFVLNEILKLDNHILKSLATEDVIKSLYACQQLCGENDKYFVANHFLSRNQALQDIFVKNIGKICLFKENQPYFIEKKESLGCITLDLRKIINEPEIKLGLRYPKTTLFDNYPDKNQYLINLLLFFNKNPIDFTKDQLSKEFLSYLVFQNVNKEIMPNIYIKSEISEFVQCTKHLTPSMELFTETQKAIDTYRQSNLGSTQSFSGLQNDSEEITALENQCKDSENAGENIFYFIEKKSAIPSETSEDKDEKDNLLKVCQALASKKDDIINLLKNTQKEDLETFCLELFNISTGLASDGCVANVGTQINNFVTNKSIENAPESIKILNITLKEILYNFNREYQISDTLGGKANSDIYNKEVYKKFLINEILLVERIEEKLDSGECCKMLQKKFRECFMEGKITEEEQKNLALATILSELREHGIDLTKNCSKYSELENLYNEKMAKEKELKDLAKAETTPEKTNLINPRSTAPTSARNSEKSNIC